MSATTKRELVRLRAEIEAVPSAARDAPARIAITHGGVATELVRTDAYDASGAPLYQLRGGVERYVVVGLGGDSLVLLPEVSDPAERSDTEAVGVRGDGVPAAANGIAGFLGLGFDENGGAP